VSPCPFPEVREIPCGDQIFEVRDGRQRVAGKANVELLLGRIDKAVQSCVERGVIVVLRCPVLRRNVPRPARGDDGERQIVINVGVHSVESELNAGYLDLIATRKHDVPTAGARSAGKLGIQRAEVQRRELDIEFSHKPGIAEPTGGDAVFHGLRHFKVKPVEPFQTVGIFARRVNELHDPQDLGNCLRCILDGGRKLRVIGEHFESFIGGNVLYHSLLGLARGKMSWRRALNEWPTILPERDRGTSVVRAFSVNYVDLSPCRYTSGDIMVPMRELHGVAFSLENDLSGLRRDLLIFDKVYVLKTDRLDANGRDNLEWLESEGFLERIAASDYDEARKAIPELDPMTWRIVEKPDVEQNDFELLMKALNFPLHEFRNRALAAVFSNEEIDPKTLWPAEGSSADLAINDAYSRELSVIIGKRSPVQTTPICKTELPARVLQVRSQKTIKPVLQLAMEMLPVPSDDNSFEDFISFRLAERDKLWAFRRFLNSLATKALSEAEIRDELEWSLNEYTKAMKLHNLRAGAGFVEVYVIPALEVLEDLAKLNWSKIAKGALSVKKRQIELLEAEMKAPGRECAYVFDVRKRFGSQAHHATFDDGEPHSPPS
jgi:hypothetical protein